MKHTLGLDAVATSSALSSCLGRFDGSELTVAARLKGLTEGGAYVKFRTRAAYVKLWSILWV